MVDPLVVKVWVCRDCPFCVTEVVEGTEFYPEVRRWWCDEVTSDRMPPQPGYPPHEYRDLACPLDKHDIIIKAANV